MAGLTRRPRSTAFFASRPAPSMTLGLLVLVQLVMAAISTVPWPSSRSAVGKGDTGRYSTRSVVGRLDVISTLFIGSAVAQAAPFGGGSSSSFEPPFK